jgi:hypothetical protein
MRRSLVILGFALLAAGPWCGIDRPAGAADCRTSCAEDVRACGATVAIDRQACVAACAAAPSRADEGACRSACRAETRRDRRGCLADGLACEAACGAADGCAIDLAACTRTVAGDARACAGGCEGAVDAPACLETCGARAAAARDACRSDFGLCAGGATAAQARSLATGGSTNTGSIAPLQVTGPGAVVTGTPGQTVSLAFQVRNGGTEAVTLRYFPTFAVKGTTGVSIASISGKPSSPTSTTVLQPRSTRVIRVSVRIAPDARTGTATIVGTFSFTSPSVATVQATGQVFVPGTPNIGVGCRTQPVGTHGVRIFVDVKNLSQERVKAVRASRLTVVRSGGGSFQVTKGRVPSVVFSLAPGVTTTFSLQGVWNQRGAVHLFESASATTLLNKKIAGPTAECLPALIAQ